MKGVGVSRLVMWRAGSVFGVCRLGGWRRRVWGGIRGGIGLLGGEREGCGFWGLGAGCCSLWFVEGEGGRVL